MAGPEPADAVRSTHPPPPSETGLHLPKGTWWLAFLALALVEVAGHFVVVSRVAEEEDWAGAAELVRAEERPGDLIEVAPGWADPVLREHLGDLISFPEAGRSGMAAFDRLWVLSIRGADLPDEPAAAPDLDRRFGRVRVRRWDLGPSPVLYDFVQHVSEADVVMVRNGSDVPCRPIRSAPRGGGLGAGAMTPAERHQCDNQRPWLWVGATITEDLDLEPRHCVSQHPAGMEPIRATFRDVPLGDRLILHGGIYYEHERMREHGPVYVTVRVNGEDVGRMIHRDGDGWKRIEVDPRAMLGPDAPEDARGDVSIDVMAPEPHLRTFCWAATTQAGPRRSAP